jgi:hypothetical protein
MKSSKRLPFLGAAALWAAVGCRSSGQPTPAGEPVGEVASATQSELAARTPARPLPPTESQRGLGQAIDAFFQRTASQRFHVQLDKPLYQPGETIWFRVWELATPTLAATAGGGGITVELVSPKGATVLHKRVQRAAGVVSNDLELPVDAPGGEYLVRVTSDRGGSYDKAVVVSQYQPPAIKKKLEFLRKAYGAGDTVTAAVGLDRGTGEPLADAPATAIVTLDGVEVARLELTTGADGQASVRFPLPVDIGRGDGLLTLLVEDGGVTESIQKRIPIIARALDLALYPEGGDLVEGLPGRVYLQARDLIGKPADVAGRVLDDRGVEVARFRSLHHGLGRFELTPARGRSYAAVLDAPAGITQKVPLPAAKAAGCTLTALDDPNGQRDDLRVGIRCTAPRTVVTTATLRERRLGDASYAVAPGVPTVASFPVPADAQGAVRVTLFDDALAPLAERLIYRGRGRDLTVRVTSDRARYAPRDPVSLTIEARDLAGRPVAADLALSVVDDGVLAFADDKSAGLLARLYLESEMPGQEIDDPSFYFSRDDKAARALDLVLGTQGWRRFDWQPVLAPTPPADPLAPMAATVAEMAPMPAAPPPAAQAPRGPRAARPALQDRPADQEAPLAEPARGRRLEERAGMGVGVAVGGAVGRGAARDLDWAGDDELGRMELAWAPVRQFPAPSYDGDRVGPRTDFRETIFWAPSVKTDARGKATVRFYLSDAVTSFRARAEGATAGGLLGTGDALLASKLPVSLAVTMPLEVSAGDTIELPIALANETDRPQSARLDARFGKAFELRDALPTRVELAPGQRTSLRAHLAVVGDGEEAKDGEAVVAIDAGELTDEVARTIRVVPLGFPREVSLAGTLARRARHEVELAGALPGTIEASVQLYPSPLATMVQGTEAMLQEPGGCFEQASSSNYPNVMVLGYLEQHDVADPALVERAGGMLDRGYKLLTGYESPKQGYEWFGGDPGHEALTAYGLMEFVDMAKVYGDVDRAMIARTRAWLRSRRDGKGGFRRNDRALDSFGSASPEVTDGYVTYAMTEAGERDLVPEIARQTQVARTTQDPYLLALATGTLLNVARADAATRGALERLRGLQGKDGGFAGADHSITRSGGEALAIETTALAVLALIEAGEAATPAARRAIEWLNAHRGGLGNFASTQATILSLRAITAYAEASRATEAAGVVRLIVNGERVGERRFAKGERGALVFDGVAGALRPGKNTIELELDSAASLPYSVALSYRTRTPASSPDSPIALRQSLSRTSVQTGEGVKLAVAIENTTDQGQPMTLARVGLPGGLGFQLWQLKELKQRGVIDFFETREREVVLYFRSLAPRAKKVVELELLARVPGRYVAPASRAYLYYTDEHKTWTAPLAIQIADRR